MTLRNGRCPWCCPCCTRTRRLLILESTSCQFTCCWQLRRESEDLSSHEQTLEEATNARRFCNGFGLHPDHILQQLLMSISYSEVETTAGRPLDTESVMRDYTHFDSTLFIQAIVIIFPLIVPLAERKSTFHGNGAQTTMDAASKAPNHSNRSPILRPKSNCVSDFV